MKSKWKRRFFKMLGLGLLLVLFFGGAVYGCLDLLVDYWWFDSLSYGSYFLLRLVYRYLVLSAVTLFFGLLFFFNFWIASRYLGSARPASTQARKEKKPFYPQLIRLFRSGSLKVYAPLSFVLAVFVAWPLFQHWETFLFYVFAPATGIADAAFGVDVAFYLFSLPLYALLQQRVLVAIVILLTASVILYRLERRMLNQEEKSFPRGAKIHLNLLALMLVALVAFSFMLQRYELAFSSDHMPLFFGPGYAEMHVTLPLVWISLGLWLAASLGVLTYINFKKGLITTLVLCALFAGAAGLQHSAYINGVVQKYIVDPNELSKERPYIVRNIKGTLDAYNLSDVETRNFSLESAPWAETRRAIRLNIQNIPVWDRELLDDVYDQLQGIRPYYNFTGVDVDRYRVAGSYQQVNLAAREINLQKMPAHGQNWINRHLQYTHGFGVVMTPAAQRGEEIMTWFVEGIPPRSLYAFRIDQPGIYYGLENYGYAVAPNEAGEMDYPGGDTFVTSSYEGKAGIRLSSWFKKLLLAVYLQDRNLFFTTKTTDDSRLLFRRNIGRAIHTLTPFFELDQDPYVVVTAKHLFWIQDTYTRSRHYPYATPYDGSHNYIRSPVKAVVNAYDGSIDFYLVDEKDPIAKAYQRMYPGLIKPLKEMPAKLRSHIRYPKDIFKIQMTVYQKYHQTDPATFYRQEDVWDFAIQPGGDAGGDSDRRMRPYYLTLNLIDGERQEFLLLAPMSPKNRSNLRALTIAGCDGERYGKFYVYSFPKGEQVYGPAQIGALIDQDTEIAEQFTLWDQVGSEVKRGRMLILPMGHLVFYIQPVYLSSAADLKIPQLQRLIVSQGDVVVMDTSLDKAFEKVGLALESRRGGEPRPGPGMLYEENPSDPSTPSSADAATEAPADDTPQTAPEAGGTDSSGPK